MENILFKVSFPAEFHGQTAVECAVRLHPQVRHRLEDISKIEIRTQESAMRIIAKEGPLSNAADRDHCLQYMVACGLIFGELRAEFYEDAVAANPRIDSLRAKMTVSESPQYSKDYLDPQKRSIANSLKITFKDGKETPEVAVEYPLGHRQRRKEAMPVLFQKLENNLAGRFSAAKVEQILGLFQAGEKVDKLPVPEFIDLFQ